jgi:orotate phosphoribosyltransferase
MEGYKREFIQFLEGAGVLKFGDFTAKSGRKIPYFINAGDIKTGDQIRRLGQFYAKAYAEKVGNRRTVLYGPAYKGIPLAVATAMAYSELYGKDVKYCCNRKEVKDHGDVGILLGYKLQDGDRVIMIEDVTTSGKSMEETVPIVRAQANVEIKGLIVSLNRMERGQGEKCALDEVAELYGFPTAAIVNMAEVTEHLYNKPYKGEVIIDDTLKAAIDAYYEQYGAK